MRNPFVVENGVWVAKLGNVASILSHLGKPHSPEHIEAGRQGRMWYYKQGSWNKGLKNPQPKGDKSPSWRGGVSIHSAKFKQSATYKTWRKAVIERDNYTCQVCGAHNHTGGKRIIHHVDHIKPYALYPELRVSIENGRTLCIDCHKKTDTYGFSKAYKAEILKYKESQLNLIS